MVWVIDQFCGLILAGVLTQLAIEKGVEAGLVTETGFLQHLKLDFFDKYEKLCDHNGAGYWLELSLLPFTFAIIGGVRASSNNLQRFFLIFVILFALNMTISDFGHFAMICAGFYDTKNVFAYVSVAIPALVAVVITGLVIFL